MNQQFTDIINDQLEPILEEFISQTLTSSSIINSPLKLIRQSNVVEIQNVHTKYKRVIQETIILAQKILVQLKLEHLIQFLYSFFQYLSKLVKIQHKLFFFNNLKKSQFQLISFNYTPIFINYISTSYSNKYIYFIKPFQQNYQCTSCIQTIIFEIEKYYQQLIEKNQAINFKLYQRIAELTSNIQQLQDIVNQLTFENLQFRNKQNEEEITQEFYDPQQYTIRQQKKELLELYDLSDLLSNKLKRQESVNSQQQDTIKRQNSQLNFQEKLIAEQSSLIADLKSQILELQKQQSELQQINAVQKQSQKILDHQNHNERNDIHSSKAKYSTLNQNESIETQQQSNKITSQLKNLATTDQETATQPSQKCIIQKRQKLILQSLEYQNCSDFEVSVKNRQYYQNTIKKTELLDISDIIKPKYKKKPSILDDLYLYSNRYRNSSVDHYYEPPKQYRFNVKQTLKSPLSQRKSHNSKKNRLNILVIIILLESFKIYFIKQQQILLYNTLE